MSFALRTIPTGQNPGDYLPDPRLKRAVELAYALDKPRLVSGEPGTGKTQLAYYTAAVLAAQTDGESAVSTVAVSRVAVSRVAVSTVAVSTVAPFLPEPVVFHTKSSSSAQDLFYTYDAVGHFRSKPEAGKSTSDFLDFTALGRARVLAHGRVGLEAHVAERVRQGQAKPDAWATLRPLLDGCAGLADSPRSSVVLIDEVDKAPREFPNDLLNETESGEFRMRELDFSLRKAETGARVLVILTSNFEKSLPNAFLRRCVFYHIPFPDDAQLLEIVNRRLGLGGAPAVGEALRRFRAFRDQAKQASSRVPSTAEFLDWLRVLREGGFPTLVFQPRLVEVEYLFLVDRSQARSLQVALFEYLFRAFQRENVGIERFFFSKPSTGSPTKTTPRASRSASSPTPTAAVRSWCGATATPCSTRSWPWWTRRGARRSVNSPNAPC